MMRGAVGGAGSGGDALRYPPAADRGAYAVWIGAIWAAVLVGFGLDFPHFLAEVPPPPLIMHVHAAVFVLWLVLVTLQIVWVETGNVRRHMRLGWLTVALSALMVPLGLATTLVDQARQVNEFDYSPEFLALPFEEMFVFSVFMAAGVLYRRNPAAHKRLMVLSAVSISDVGFARVWMLGFRLEIPGLFGWWIQYFWGIFLLLIAMGVWDVWRRGRVHPAVLFGALFIWAGEISATLLNFSPGWRAVMSRLVTAWGWAG